MLPCFPSFGLRVRPGTLAHAPFDTVTARRQHMVRDAIRGYLALANGLTEVTAGRARAAAKALAEQGEATAGQVSALAEDLISTSRRNRESLLLLVRHEVEQAVKRLGLAPSGDIEELTRRVREVERTVRELKAAGRATEQAAPGKKPPAPKKDAHTSTKKSAQKSTQNSASS
jgi:polyhydroxyalkanoate synthesis regulator phasin